MAELSPVVFSTALLTHDLDHLGTVLSDTFDAHGPPVAESLAALYAGLAAAVASYRGLQLTLNESDPPVVLTVIPAPPRDLPIDTDGREPLVTSLRLPLTLLQPTFHANSRIVFYAATPGAFVDLAADLTYALTPRAGNHPIANPPVANGRVGAVPGQRPVVTVDTELLPPRAVIGISGLTERSTINYALGVLVDRGHHPDDVLLSLRRQAAASGMSPVSFARRLLAGLTRPRSRLNAEDD